MLQLGMLHVIVDNLYQFFVEMLNVPEETLSTLFVSYEILFCEPLVVRDFKK